MCACVCDVCECVCVCVCAIQNIAHTLLCPPPSPSSFSSSSLPCVHHINDNGTDCDCDLQMGPFALRHEERCMTGKGVEGCGAMVCVERRGGVWAAGGFCVLCAHVPSIQVQYLNTHAYTHSLTH